MKMMASIIAVMFVLMLIGCAGGAGGGGSSSGSTYSAPSSGKGWSKEKLKEMGISETGNTNRR